MPKRNGVVDHDHDMGEKQLGLRSNWDKGRAISKSSPPETAGSRWGESGGKKIIMAGSQPLLLVIMHASTSSWYLGVDDNVGGVVLPKDMTICRRHVGTMSATWS